MIPSCFNKPLFALLVFAFLSTPQSFAQNDRDKKDPSYQFASLLSNPLKDSSRDDKVSKQSRRASAPSALKQKQNQQKRERMFEKSARKAEELIKKYKIDVNQKVKLPNWDHPIFPVIIAAKTGNIPMMKTLIKHGANLDIKLEESHVMSKFDSAVLVAAEEAGCLPMVELLLEHIPNAAYCQFASLLNNPFKDSSLDEKESKSSKQNRRASAPSALKQEQKREQLLEKSAREAEKLIKKYNIDVNQKVKGRYNREKFPVIITAESGNVPMMKVLIKYGVNLDLKEQERNFLAQPDHSAILNAAAASGHIPMMKLLLEHMQHIPDLDVQRLGTTKMAARQGDLNMLRFLKEQGIPFHSSCLEIASHACTILSKCHLKQKADCEHLVIMQYLLENGFDIKKDRGGALAWACLGGHEKMVHFLLEHGAECDIHTVAICHLSGSAIVKAGEGGNLNIIKMLLAKGANIHDTDKYGSNALHLASQYGQADVIPFLIRQGINVNTTNCHGETPLILAAQFGRLDTVKALLAEGADTSIKDHKGKTAAGHALESSNHTETTLQGIDFNQKEAEETYQLLNNLTR